MDREMRRREAATSFGREVGGGGGGGSGHLSGASASDLGLADRLSLAAKRPVVGGVSGAGGVRGSATASAVLTGRGGEAKKD